MFGISREHFDEVDSTNARAKALALAGAPHGSAVTADFQSAGRGREDRSWQSGRAANLLVSFLVYPERPMEEWGGLSLLAGIAVHELLRESFTVAADLKWPNDVLVSGRKIAGVLIETGQIDGRAWAVIGVGVNVNQTNFDGDYLLPPTSLALECGRDADRQEVFSALCGQLDIWYARWRERGTASIATAWRARSGMLGRKAVVRDGDARLEVLAVDIAPDGALLVEDADGTRRLLYAGDVFPSERAHD